MGVSESILDQFVVLLEPSGTHLGSLWSDLGPAEAPLDSSWGHLGPTWTYLGPSGGSSGSTLGHRATISSP